MQHIPPKPNWFDSSRNRLRNIYLFCLASVAVQFAVVSMFLPRFNEPALSHPDHDSMQMLFSIGGLGLCFLAMLFNQKALNPKKVLSIAKPNRSQSKDHKEHDHVKNYIMFSFIFTWFLALCSSLCGLVLSWLLNEASQFTVFGFISFLTILAHPYTEGRIKRAISLL